MQYTDLQSHFRPTIRMVLLGEGLISSKTDPHNGSKIQKRNFDEVKNNKTMLKMLPFIRIFYPKHQNSIL